MRVLSSRGMWNGVLTSYECSHYDETIKLPQRYLKKKKARRTTAPPANMMAAAKLTTEQVYRVRAMGDDGILPSVAAKEFGIGRACARNIMQRKSYVWLPEREAKTYTPHGQRYKVRELMKHGKTMNQAAACLGLSPEYVKRLMAPVKGALCNAK